ncbi:transposase [Amycolatopsis sp. NPDC004169]|uniref:transposase n=1 Tax=Amycolatopsis sp. NPDC004169 TaxID=3154453 RepID=UPI0033A92F13
MCTSLAADAVAVDRVRGDKAYFLQSDPRTFARPRHRRRDSRGGRNAVERQFNLLKQWRSLATRYDKLAIVDRAAVVLHAVITWTKGLSDTP